MVLDDLYQEILLDHYKNPRNRGVLEQPDVHLDAKNPFCSDEITIDFTFKEDRIKDIRFQGEGCVISQASVSLLTESVKGKTIEEALDVVEQFTKLIRGEIDALDPELEELMAMQGVSAYPTRVKCALLAWNTLKKALSDDKEKGNVNHA
jgi:nitrogen fixation protein NifU and related proteins